jgi:hypothetical protein
MSHRMSRLMRIHVEMACQQRRLSFGNDRNITAILYELENQNITMRSLDRRGRLRWRLTPEAAQEDRAERKACEKENSESWPV